MGRIITALRDEQHKIRTMGGNQPDTAIIPKCMIMDLAKELIEINPNLDQGKIIEALEKDQLKEEVFGLAIKVSPFLKDGEAYLVNSDFLLKPIDKPNWSEK